MNKEPETYDELILQRRCVELTKYYELSKEEVEKIYEWVKGNGTLKGGATGVSLYKGDILKDTILTRKTVSIDGLLLTKESLKVYPHHIEQIHYSGGGSRRSSYSGGSSNNNNNNHNNNNNNNNNR